MELPTIRRQPNGMREPSASVPEYVESRPQFNVSSRLGWSSPLNQCCDDEETCWIGTWCPFLLAGRTASQFQIVNSWLYFGFSTLYWVLFAISFVSGSMGFFVFLSIVGCCVWPFIKAHTRMTIRGKLGIRGNFFGDYLVHCCCCTHTCATCQEAREAKAAGLPLVDLCSGEKLPDMSALAPNTELVDGSATTGPSVHSIENRGDEMTLSSPPPGVPGPDGSWLSMTYISKTGKIVLIFEALIFILSVIILLALGRTNAVMILFLVFVQPLVILYYFYWKKQKNTVQLDAIIKLFATGFFVTTFQSWCFEQLVETMGIIIFAPWISRVFSGGDVDDDVALDATTDDTVSGSGVRSDVTSQLLSLTSSGLSRGFAALCDHVTAMSGMQDGLPPLSYHAATDHSSGSEGNTAATEDSGGKSSVQVAMGHNWFGVFLACFFVAFCVAAAVEETMKQFIVRCNRFATPLTDPYTVTTYLMAGALGFTTCENMMYVFNTTSSPIPGTSAFVGELMVLLLRVCLPVHLICSVLQGANLSRIVMGKLPEMGLFSMLFSAIVLHGTFDCTLFVMSIVAFVNDIDGFWFDALTFAMAFFIAGVGSLYAYRQWKHVTNDFNNGWHQVSEGSTHNVMSMVDEDTA